MSIRIGKQWLPLNAETVAALPAQLGVYQVADAAGTVLSIGFAGAQHPFGIRTALEQEMEQLPVVASSSTEPALFRYEFTSNYRSRWNELLMIHQADFGQLPPAQAELSGRIGKLSPTPDLSPSPAN